MLGPPKVVLGSEGLGWRTRFPNTKKSVRLTPARSVQSPTGIPFNFAKGQYCTCLKRPKEPSSHEDRKRKTSIGFVYADLLPPVESLLGDAKFPVRHTVYIRRRLGFS